jgi:hypothetical protein
MDNKKIFFYIPSIILPHHPENICQFSHLHFSQNISHSCFQYNVLSSQYISISPYCFLHTHLLHLSLIPIFTPKTSYILRWRE